VINTSRSERGWRGRRRIAVLVSIAGVLGVAALGSANTASAATVAGCKPKLEPQGKSTTSAKLSFVCDAPIRAYTLGTTGRVKSYGAPSAGSASGFLGCLGSGAGFGCGVPDRAAPGTQPRGTTGWTAPVPPYPGATANPLTCGGFKKVAGTGTATDPNRNGIIGAPCTQLIPAGTKVTQSIKLGTDPCGGAFQAFLLVGGEPAVTSFTVTGDSSTVGEYLQSPIPVNLKAYKGCQSSGGAKAKKGSAHSSATTTNFPVVCGGSITPDPTTPGDAKDRFVCNMNIRAFAIYSNVPIVLPGDEPIISGTSGGGAQEGALHQCEGGFPGPGFGCGIVDRQAQSALLPNGQAISAGNTVEQTMGFDSTPCKRKGQPKPKAWLVAMGEPVVGSSAGEYTSAPQPLALSGFKCKAGKKK
jgi:hypothetical protein